jgi:hypothetical protein
LALALVTRRNAFGSLRRELTNKGTSCQPDFAHRSPAVPFLNTPKPATGKFDSKAHRTNTLIDSNGIRQFTGSLSLLEFLDIGERCISNIGERFVG